MIKKLAIVCTHPIQYNVPFFIALAHLSELALKVFYTYNPKEQGYFDQDFNKSVKWDVPVEEGYDFEFVANTSSKPSTSFRKGIVNPDLIPIIQVFKPDAILVYGWNHHSHWQAIKAFYGVIPVLFRGDSTNIDKANFWRTFIRRLYLKHVYRHVDYALYCGSANKAYFQNHGIIESRLINVPHAVDNQRFQSSNKSLREQWDLPESAIVILFAGKFIRKKAPEKLMNAFLTLEKPSKENVHLVFIGDGELKASLISVSKVSEKVHIKPFVNQSDMPAAYAACDLFCLPSVGPGETWGLAVNEAMAVGKAILISDRAGCAQDLIKNGENGYIFSHDVDGDLQRKLELLISDRQKLHDMGNVSRQIIRNWDYQTGVNNLSELLSTL